MPTEVAIAKASRILNASDSSSLEAVIRPGTLNPNQVYQRLEALELEHGEPSEPRWIGSVDSLALPMESVLIAYEDGHQRLLDFNINESGDWRADLDAYFRFCKPAFSELADGSADSGLVRVIAARDFYFNGPYVDEDTWACFSLRPDRRAEPLYAYCRKDSGVMRVLARIEAKAKASLSSGKEPSSRSGNLKARLTLRIKRKAGAARNQFEITELLSDSWSIPEIPFSETLENATPDQP